MNICIHCNKVTDKDIPNHQPCPNCGKRDWHDKSFTAHDDAVSDGCVDCGNEWQSLNKHGRCSWCQMVWEG